MQDCHSNTNIINFMNIQKFYNSIGWKKNQDVFEDAKLFEDLRKNSKEYVSKCRKRILRYIPKKGKNILDFIVLFNIQNI